MARVFTTNLNMASGSKWGELRLDITPGKPNIANNTTPITYELYLQRTATNFGGYYSDYANSATLTINGTAIAVSNFTYNFSTNYKKSIKTGSMTITHGADGKKSVSASASVSLPGGSVPGGSGSGSLALTTIPRASSIGTISGNQIGSSITVNISRASTSFTHYVFYHLPGQGWQQVTTNATTSSTFTIPGSSVSFLPNAASGQLNIMVRTYSGGTRIGGDITKTHTVYVPTSTFTVPSSFNVGSAFTVSVSRAATQLTHEISLHDGSTALYWSGNNVTTSGSPNVAANTLIARMSGVKSKAFTVRVSTYNGSAAIGSTSKTITANIPISTFTIPSSFTMGNAFNVSISRVGSLTQWVLLEDGGSSLYSSGNTIGTSDSVNVALSTLAARSPNSMSKIFSVRVDTYNGGTWIGSQTKNITAYVPSSVKPTFSSLSVSENVSSVASLVGAFVQTKSKLNLAITGASGVHGSTIRSYNIAGVGHNVNSSSTVTGYLSVSGNQTIKGIVTDSRGQTFERSLVVNILPYTPPTLSGLSFRRTLANKTEAPLGDNATVRANVKVHSLIVNGVQKNSIKYHVQSAQSGGSFADKANTTSTDLTKSYSDVWVGYSVDHSYNFRVRVGDVFGFGGWSVGVVPTGVVTQQWGSKTTSFGKMIDNTGYNVQVGSGGIQSDGPILAEKGIRFPDTRDVISKSEDLPGNAVSFEFKRNTSVGNPPVTASSQFSHIINVAGWSSDEGSGGWPTQVSVGADGLATRQATGATTWGPWTKVSIDGHTHAWSAITGKPAQATRWPQWNEVSGKPGKFEPSSLPIPGNNLNNAMAPGFYHWLTGVTNSPTDYGSMIVTAWDGTGAGQTAEQLVVKNGVMWVRGRNNAAGSWSAWRQVLNTSTISVDSTKTSSNYSTNGGPGSYTAISSLSASDKGIMIYYTNVGNGYMGSLYIPRQFFDTWFTVSITTTTGYFQIQSSNKRIYNSPSSNANYVLKGYEIHK